MSEEWSTSPPLPPLRAYFDLTPNQLSSPTLAATQVPPTSEIIFGPSDPAHTSLSIERHTKTDSSTYTLLCSSLPNFTQEILECGTFKITIQIANHPETSTTSRNTSRRTSTSVSRRSTTVSNGERSREEHLRGIRSLPPPIQRRSDSEFENALREIPLSLLARSTTTSDASMPSPTLSSSPDTLSFRYH